MARVGAWLVDRVVDRRAAGRGARCDKAACANTSRAFAAVGAWPASRRPSAQGGDPTSWTGMRAAAATARDGEYRTRASFRAIGRTTRSSAPSRMSPTIQRQRAGWSPTGAPWRPDVGKGWRYGWSSTGMDNPSSPAIRRTRRGIRGDAVTGDGEPDTSRAGLTVALTRLHTDLADSIGGPGRSSKCGSISSTMSSDWRWS